MSYKMRNMVSNELLRTVYLNWYILIYTVSQKRH